MTPEVDGAASVHPKLSQEDTSIVIIDALDRAYAQQVANDHSVTIKEVPAHGFEPITTATLLLIGSTVAVAAAIDSLERRKGGQVVDLRKGTPISIYRTKEVVYGTIIIIGSNGKVRIEAHEAATLFGKVLELVPNILASITEATVEEVFKTARERLKDQAIVTKDGESPGIEAVE